jgi:hypothetical protein
MLPLILNVQIFQNMCMKEKIVGTWSLISMTYKDKDEKTMYFFGENPKGYLTYDPNGIINVQFMMNNRKNFGSEVYGSGTPSEIQEAFGSYQAYFGRYYEMEAGVITHEIEGCIFPNWSGKKEIRYARVEGDKLYLTTPPTQVGDQVITVVALWKRM